MTAIPSADSSGEIRPTDRDTVDGSLPLAGAIPVYVISLARATERRAAIEAHLRRAGIPYEILDAVDGRALDDDFVSAVIAPGVDLSRGMIGCNLSHLEAYRRLVESGRSAALILEDDARVDHDVATILRSIPDAPRFDICLLDCLNRHEHGPVFYDQDDRFDLGGGYTAYRLSAGPQTLHAYLISRSGAVRRIAESLPLREAIDSYDHVSPPMRFYAQIGRLAAWVSEHSIDSMTSKGGRLASSPTLRALRRHRWFHELRDWLKATRLRHMLLARLMRAEYFIDPQRRWRAMPSGRPVIYGD